MGEVTRNRLIGLDEYINTFSDNRPTTNPNKARITIDYFRVIEKDVRDRFNPLEGNPEAIDTTLEWALTSYYSLLLCKSVPTLLRLYYRQNRQKRPNYPAKWKFGSYLCVTITVCGVEIKSCQLFL